MNPSRAICDAARELATHYEVDPAVGYAMLIDWSRISRYPLAETASMVMRDARHRGQRPTI